MQNQDQQHSTAQPDAESVEQSRPNESGSFHIDAVIKIWDPNTNETILETRA